MKKVFIILLNAIIVLSIFSLLSGCGAKGSGEVKHDFTISNTKITLEVGEEFLLIASCGDCEIEFVSSDVECATVSDKGLIKALKTGKTFVVVSSQGATNEMICEVSVIMPEYSVVFVQESNYTVSVGANKEVCAKTLRDGVEYKGTITFSVEGEGATILQTNGSSAILRFSQAGDYEVIATDQFGNQGKIIIKVINNA